MASEVETLILRFRDLATAEGETIALHQQIIKKHDYVWWGWWNKFGEQVPDELFAELNARMHEAPLSLYLFDSGKNELRRARCEEIRWSQKRERLQSPEPKRTPEYYKAQQYFAWFKFTDIASKRQNPEILKKLTYLEVPEFFESRASRFSSFSNKRIESPHELQEQNRTIWFVRRFKPGDKTGLTSPPRQRTENPFSAEPLASYSSSLLWLSDTHFGNHAFPLTTDHFRKDLSQALESDLKQTGQNSVAGAILSGDLTWKNEEAEFEQARQFLSGLRSWSTLDPSRILFCPGNHDLKFSADPSKTGETADIAPEAAKRGYSTFYERVYGHAPNHFLSSGRRFLVGNALAVDVVCLNSSLLDQVKDAFQGQGFVGDPQLAHAAAQMGWDTPTGENAPRTFRIVVLHHHLLPVTYREIPSIGYAASITWDAEAIVRWVVKHRVDLVLHGHMHDPFIATVSRPRFDSSGNWHTFHVAVRTARRSFSYPT